MTIRLNKNRPYAQVYYSELPGVQWQQDNRYFRYDGTLFGEETDEPLKAERSPAEEEEHLRTQMEIYNQPWTTKNAARKFLAGRE